MSRLAPLALLALLAVGGAPALSGCDSSGSGCPSGAQFSTEDLTPEGTELGASIQLGQCVSVDYVGRLADGSGTFDEGTLTFFYTPNSGIQGFILGLTGLRVGESRRIVIPPELGYRDQEIEASEQAVEEGRVGIPACSVLEFDVTLTRIYQDARECSL